MLRMILLLVVLATAVGCKERGLDFDLPYAGNQLVIFSQTKVNDTIKIEIQRTYPPTGQSTYIDDVKNATVKLFDMNGFVEILKHKGNGLYASSTGLVWKENESYRVEAEAPGYPQATTDFDTMPTTPVVLAYEFSKDIGSKSNAGEASRELVVKIQDEDVTGPNYYMIMIKRIVGKETIGVINFNLNKPGEYEDPCEFSYFATFILSDVCKKEGVITFKKGLELRYAYSLNIDTTARDIIVVSTRQISKSYYEFCNTYYNEDDLIVAFNPPYARYSNVSGGYGIFAAYNEVEKEFILRE